MEGWGTACRDGGGGDWTGWRVGGWVGVWVCGGRRRKGRWIGRGERELERRERREMTDEG